MKKILATFLCSWFINSLAQASVITYEFTAIVDLTFQSNLDYSNVQWNSPVAIRGSTINLGDTVKGRLSFDTATPATIRYLHHTIPFMTSYMNTGSIIFAYDQSGFKFHSGPLGNPQCSVANDSVLYDGDDGFGCSTTSREQPNESAEFSLFDSTGTALNSTELPTALDLNRFSQRDLYYRYFDEKITFDVNSTLTSLRRVSEVPEPGTFLILLTGFGMLGFCFNRAKQP
jgi:hypothetical protein